LEELPATRVAWLAGLVDGEGCLYARHSTKTQNSIEVRLELQTVSLTMIDAVAEILDALNVSYTREAPRMQPKSTRPAIRLRVTPKASLHKLLTALLPYLVNKRPEAVRLLAFLDAAVAVKHYRLQPADHLVAHDLKALKRLA